MSTASRVADRNTNAMDNRLSLSSQNAVSPDTRSQLSRYYKISRHFLLTLHDTSPTHAVLPASNMHYISVQNVLISWKILFKWVTQGLQQPTKHWHKLGISNGQFNMTRFLTDISLTAVKFHDIHRISRQVVTVFCLQCFDAVGWAAGRASGL